MFLVRKNPDCVGCQVTTLQSQYILATEGCWSLNQNPKSEKDTLQFMFIEFRRFLPLSVMLLSQRFKLFSLQLVCVSAVDKCLTPLSVISSAQRFKLFSLQLVCVSIGHKWLTPLSVISLSPNFNPFSSQKPWLCWLPGNNFAISIHPIATEGCWSLNENLKFL